MELKQATVTIAKDIFFLLIVPYGIETNASANQENDSTLLIVPYGIETFLLNTSLTLYSLLIVPYGIETLKLFIIMLIHLFF